jgi:hypothetical protein
LCRIPGCTKSTPETGLYVQRRLRQHVKPSTPVGRSGGGSGSRKSNHPISSTYFGPFCVLAIPRNLGSDFVILSQTRFMVQGRARPCLVQNPGLNQKSVSPCRESVVDSSPEVRVWLRGCGYGAGSPHIPPHHLRVGPSKCLRLHNLGLLSSAQKMVQKCRANA